MPKIHYTRFTVYSFPVDGEVANLLDLLATRQTILARQDSSPFR